MRAGAPCEPRPRPLALLPQPGGARALFLRRLRRGVRCSAQETGESRAVGIANGHRGYQSRGGIARPLRGLREETSMNSLIIKDLHVSVAEREIVRGLDLEVERGKVHAIMGPNGSGKSTLAKVLGGHPDYRVTSGEVWMDGVNLLELEPDERSRKGLFLAFQYPSEVPGVSIANFLRAALQARLDEGEELEATDYYAKLYEKMALLEMDRAFTARSVNENFSGGEKKRNEILQMAMLEPSYGILDETDSGLDIDALKIVANGVNSLRGPELGILLITHYQRLLNFIVPDYVHVMMQGRIVLSGGKELAFELEEKGYDWVKEEAGELAAV